MKYSRICKLIEDGITSKLPSKYITVMYDDDNFEQRIVVKINNKFGVAGYTFVVEYILHVGIDAIVHGILSDFIVNDVEQ